MESCGLPYGQFAARNWSGIITTDSYPKKGIKEHKAIGRMIVLEEFSKETAENGRMMGKTE